MSDLPPTAGADTEIQRTPPAPDGGAAPDPAAGTDRYVLLEEIARGGMGVVYKAHDRVLDRSVGLKTLLKRASYDSGVVKRFHEEAHITGKLQHPCIPPVHDLGTLPDGRPFLVMKLILGQTLDARLRDRPDLAHDRGALVSIFEHISQAVAFAHSSRVIHRDLKPQNVMVGAFGEVQVMDWGLAKQLRIADCGLRIEEQSGEAETAVLPVCNPQSAIRNPQYSATHAGVILGTPAYMPREQAVGAIDLIDTWSDVFCLGGILCTILTGSPPYAAPDFESTRQMAAFAKLDEAFARLDVCGGDPMLVALCKRCLAAEPAERPRDAGELVAALAEWREFSEERSRQSELATATRIAKLMGRQQSASNFGAFVIVTGAVTLILCYAIIALFAHVFR